MKKFIYSISIAFALSGISGLYTKAAAQTTVKTETKTGWDHKKKDAAIGAGAGAVTGAIVSKHNRGSGAVIGGGAGYLYGRHKDKKHPQYKKTVH